MSGVGLIVAYPYNDTCRRLGLLTVSLGNRQQMWNIFPVTKIQIIA
jgi:hypothetical protein